MTYSPLLSQNTALRGNLRGLLNISAWLCKTVCSVHNKRCLGVNVLEKGEKIFIELTLGALRWSPLIINTPPSVTPRACSSSGPVMDPVWGQVWSVHDWPSRDCRLITMGTKRPVPVLQSWQYLLSWLPIALSRFSVSAAFRDRRWLRSIWLCSFSYGCSVFDLQALILNRFFSVVLQTYPKKNQRSLRPLDVTVNLKITSKLSVSPYNEIAQWLALHNNVYSFSLAVTHSPVPKWSIKERSYFCTSVFSLPFFRDVWPRKPQDVLSEAHVPL